MDSSKGLDFLQVVPDICLNVDGNFVLRPEKAVEWMELQDLLILISSLMKNIPSYLLGPSLALITPSCLGFSRSFDTPHAACLRAIGAQDWFIVWMGQLSFLFAHFQHKGETSIPRWFSFLKSQGIVQSWLHGMRSSIVCNFSTYSPHVGVFLDFLKNWKYQPSVDWYTSLNVPVWYPWTDKHKAKHTTLIPPASTRIPPSCCHIPHPNSHHHPTFSSSASISTTTISWTTVTTLIPWQ